MMAVELSDPHDDDSLTLEDEMSGLPSVAR